MGSESSSDVLGISRQYLNERWSLDILNLLNLSTNAQECYSPCVEVSALQENLKDALSGPIEALLDGANSDTWPAIRNLLKRETDSAVSSFSTALSVFDMDEQTRRNMITSLEDYAKGVVEAKAREESARVLIRMKDRFTTLFSHDSDSMPRVWKGKEDIRAITKTARSACLKLLSVMVAIRLDANSDNIEKILAVALLDPPSSKKDRSIAIVDPLASSSWPGRDSFL
ncbi:hypothetical protein K1719_019616 [Acacia pycnantha]|nr:hypothetical protein K1719_019616 [Acacia pycnantha]